MNEKRKTVISDWLDFWEHKLEEWKDAFPEKPRDGTDRMRRNEHRIYAELLELMRDRLESL